MLYTNLQSTIAKFRINYTLDSADLQAFFCRSQVLQYEVLCDFTFPG